MAITLEFLSSLKIKKFISDHYAFSLIEFRLLNKKKYLTMENLSRINVFSINGRMGYSTVGNFDMKKF